MTRTSTRRPCSEGFTLLEVLISMGLIAIALLAVFRLQAQNLDLQSEAQFMTLSRYLAQERASRIQATKPMVEGRHSGEFSEEFLSLKYEEDLEEVRDLKGLFKVKIKIFNEQSVGSEAFSFESYLFSQPK